MVNRIENIPNTRKKEWGSPDVEAEEVGTPLIPDQVDRLVRKGVSDENTPKDYTFWEQAMNEVNGTSTSDKKDDSEEESG